MDIQAAGNKLSAHGLITMLLHVKLFQREMVQLGLQTLSNDILEYKPAQDDQAQHRQSGTMLIKMLSRQNLLNQSLY